MMKADILSEFDTIKVCTQYKTVEGNIDFLPYDIEPDKVQPHYEELPGWKSDLTQLRDNSQVPQALTNYIEYLEQKLDIPITMVSVGPDRTQTIVREKSLA